MNLDTFKQKIAEWYIHLEVEKNVSSHTLRAYIGDTEQFTCFWQQLATQEPLLTDDFDRVLERYVRALFYKKTSRATLARKVASLRSLRRYFLQHGIPFRVTVKPPRVEKKLPHVLSVDEIFYLLDTLKPEDLPSKLPYRDKAIIELLYATGVRCSELVAIKLDDINSADRAIRIMGKGRTQRFVLYGSKAQESLTRYLEQERPALAAKEQNKSLFLNAVGGALTSRSVQRVCEMFRSFLEIERPLTPHKIRHSFATHLLNQGVDVRVIKELLGHKTLATTEIYTHVTSAELSSMCDRLHPLSAPKKTKDHEER